jgi:hypothetical protein
VREAATHLHLELEAFCTGELMVAMHICVKSWNDEQMCVWLWKRKMGLLLKRRTKVIKGT